MSLNITQYSGDPSTDAERQTPSVRQLGHLPPGRIPLIRSSFSSAISLRMRPRTSCPPAMVSFSRAGSGTEAIPGVAEGRSSTSSDGACGGACSEARADCRPSCCPLVPLRRRETGNPRLAMGWALGTTIACRGDLSTMPSLRKTELAAPDRSLSVDRDSALSLTCATWYPRMVT